MIFSQYDILSPNRKPQKCTQQFGHHFYSQKLIYLATVGPQVFPELTLWGRSTEKILTAQLSQHLSINLAWQMFHLWFSIHWGQSRSSVRSADTALLIQSILGFCKFIITHYDFTCSYFTPKVVHLWKQPLIHPLIMLTT